MERVKTKLARECKKCLNSVQGCTQPAQHIARCDLIITLATQKGCRPGNGARKELIRAWPTSHRPITCR